jgi:hypothetical protein
MSAGISLVERPSQPTVCYQHTATYFSLGDSSMFATMTAPTRVSSPSPAVFSSTSKTTTTQPSLIKKLDTNQFNCNLLKPTSQLHLNHFNLLLNHLPFLVSSQFLRLRDHFVGFQQHLRSNIRNFLRFVLCSSITATRVTPDFLVNFDSHLRDFSLVLNDFLFNFRPLLHDYFHNSSNGLPALFNCCQHQLLQFSDATSAFHFNMQSDLANYRRYLQPCIPDLNQQSRQIDRIPTNSADILCVNLDSRFDILESQYITLIQLINTKFTSISSPAVPDSSACRLPVVSSISSSDQIVINLSLAEFEPRGKINDFDTCHLFLFLFHRYKELGGSKKLSTLLQVPFDSNKPYLSNFSSLFFEFDDHYLLGDVYIENKLCSI